MSDLGFQVFFCLYLRHKVLIFRICFFDIGKGAHMPQDALTLNEELINLRTRVKQQEKEIKRLKAENEFLEEASAFFAASRRKSPKN